MTVQEKFEVLRLVMIFCVCVHLSLYWNRFEIACGHKKGSKGRGHSFEKCVGKNGTWQGEVDQVM